MTQPETESTAITKPTGTPTWTAASALVFAEDPQRWHGEERGGTASLRQYATRVPHGCPEALRAVAPPGMTLAEIIREALRRELLRLSRAAVRAEAKRAQEAGQ